MQLNSWIADQTLVYIYKKKLVTDFFQLNLK